MQKNKIFTALLFTILMGSCKIGNFMDIEDRNNYDGALYLYAATSSGLLIFQVDTQTGTLSEKGTDNSITTGNNACKFVYENSKNNLFISHETTVPARITGFDVNPDGSLDKLPGYPVGFPGANSVHDFIFTEDKRFLYALSSDGLIYGFNYNSDGSISPTAQILLADYTPPIEGFFMFDNHIVKNDNTGWESYSIAGDGTIASYLTGYNLGAGTGECPAASNGYIFKLLLGAAGANLGNSYILNINNTATTAVSTSISIGAVAGSNTTNALVKDPQERFLYFVSINENNIYCLRTNTDGTIGIPIDYIPTGEKPGAAAIDPYREFFFTASGDAVLGYQINIHRMNGDLPETVFNNISVTDQVFELAAVRYNN